MSSPNDILDLPNHLPKDSRIQRLKNLFSLERLLIIAVLLGFFAASVGGIGDSETFYGLLVLEFILFPLGFLLVGLVLAGVLYFFIKNYKKTVFLIAIWLYILVNIVFLLGTSIDLWSW